LIPFKTFLPKFMTFEHGSLLEVHTKDVLKINL